MGSLLGGDASPIGWTVQYLEAPRDVIMAEIVKARREWGHAIEVVSPGPFPDVLHDLLPFEAPWTRELAVSCGRWTAYLDHGINGGDATAIGAALMTRSVSAWSSPAARRGTAPGTRQPSCGSSDPTVNRP